MSKNILVTARYEVENMYGKTTPEDYKAINNKCVESFNKHLANIDESIVLEGKVRTYHELFKNIYWEIRKIYHDQPCNILWSDSDNICLRPLEIFGQFNKFCMFYNIDFYGTQWVDERCKQLAKPLVPWMMANLRYYPAGMSSFLWDIGDDLAYSWIEDWAYECIIYNKMFHSQGIYHFNEFILPEWNVQAEGELNSITKELVKDAVILHCHSTRNSSLVIPKMDKAIQISKED